MAFKDLLKGLFSNNDKQIMQQAKFFDGYSPIFSQFGQNVYASDIVQMCIDVIASEISKLQPQHIRTDSNGMQKNVNSSINRLFKFSPNGLMTTRDFLEKIIWLLFMNFNAFIYPTYVIKTDNRGNEYKDYTGFYPLNPTQVTFLQDQSQNLFVELRFANGDKFTLAYSDVIHLRKRFSLNDIMGGGMNGQPDNQALLNVLSINDVVLQGLGKAIKTSLSVRGILKINTMLDDDKQQAERARFETTIASGESSILPLDLKGDYVDLKPDPKIVDKDTMEFLENKVLRYFGVSIPVLNGDYTDEQYQAFYEKTLEPIVLSLGQSFSKTLFTQRELDVGNEMVFYQKNMMYLSTTAKLKLLDTVGAQGLLTDDQKLAVLGFPPLSDGSGSRRTMSLNYIDVNLANAYQLNQAKQGGKENGNQTTN